jgi:hypothetical protein
MGVNTWARAHHVPKLVAAATDDDGSVRSANEVKKNAIINPR